MTTWLAAWRDTTAARAGEHHADHDTEAADEACAAEQLAAGARACVVYRIGGDE